MPHFGINVNTSDLTSTLEQIGDNEKAVRAVGDASTRYNQARLNHFAQGGLDPKGKDDFQDDGVHQSAELAGYLQDSMINGDVDNATELAAERKRLAEFFTFPADFVPTSRLGPAAPLGDFIVGDVKNRFIEGYVGDGEKQAISQGNDAWASGRTGTKMQAYYSMLTAEGPNGETYDVGALRSDPDNGWPKKDGEFVAPGDLTQDQLNQIQRTVEQAEGNDGIDTSRSVDTSYPSLAKRFGDR